MVQQRRPHFQRMRHAHSVNLDQDIHWQITVQVDVLHHGEQVPFQLPELFELFLLRIDICNQLERLRSEEILLFVHAEQTGSIETALQSTQRQVPETVAPFEA